MVMGRTLTRLAVGAAVLLLLAAAPLAAEAQPAAKVFHVAWLSASSTFPEGEDAFRHGLQEFGWVEGRNILIVYRHAEGQLERLPEIAAELVRMKVDVILATSPAPLAAARKATQTIPIVMVFGPDPVEAGLIVGLARPGGNITGLTSLSADLSPKHSSFSTRWSQGSHAWPYCGTPPIRGTQVE
jgi:putative ABC transport system substrate-binding protein